MQAIILASERKDQALPRFGVKILDIPLIEYPIKLLKKKRMEDIFIIVGRQKDEIVEATKDQYLYVTQDQPTGTAGAIQCCLPFISSDIVLILSGDVIFLDEELITELTNTHFNNKNEMTILTTAVPTFHGCEQIHKEESRIRMIEFDSLQEEKEYNTGIYIVSTKLLKDNLHKMKRNIYGEHSFTDICNLLTEERIGTHKTARTIVGIKTVEDLQTVSKKIQLKKNYELLSSGVLLQDVENTFISPDSRIEANSYIESGSVIYHASIGKNNQILGHCRIIESVLGDDNHIEASTIEQSCIGICNKIGPYAHLRMNTDIGNHNRIGNYVELKDTIIGSHTNVAHLAYLGNCDCGSYVNFGCGSITVNYDGTQKHKTIIKDHAFIGCNSNLVAPLIVYENSYVAAGSTITTDVDENSLAIARSRQIIKEDYFRRKKNLPPE